MCQLNNTYNWGHLFRNKLMNSKLKIHILDYASLIITWLNRPVRPSFALNTSDKISLFRFISPLFSISWPIEWLLLMYNR